MFPDKLKQPHHHSREVKTTSPSNTVYFESSPDKSMGMSNEFRISLTNDPQCLLSGLGYVNTSLPTSPGWWLCIPDSHLSPRPCPVSPNLLPDKTDLTSHLIAGRQNIPGLLLICTSLLPLSLHVTYTFPDSTASSSFPTDALLSILIKSDTVVILLCSIFKGRTLSLNPCWLHCTYDVIYQFLGEFILHCKMILRILSKRRKTEGENGQTVHWSDDPPVRWSTGQTTLQNGLERPLQKQSLSDNMDTSVVDCWNTPQCFISTNTLAVGAICK